MIPTNVKVHYLPLVPLREALQCRRGELQWVEISSLLGQLRIKSFAGNTTQHDPCHI